MKLKKCPKWSSLLILLIHEGRGCKLLASYIFFEAMVFINSFQTVLYLVDHDRSKTTSCEQGDHMETAAES